MPSKKKRITVYLSPEEYDRVQDRAARAGISLSAFCKLVSLGMPVPSMEHRQAVRDILKANADLGRLGGLLKLALPEGVNHPSLPGLLREVEARQAQLRAVAWKVR